MPLGGEALFHPDERSSQEARRKALVRVALAVAQVALRHDVVVTYGNGPQVDLLALQAEAEDGSLDLQDAVQSEREGTTGYLLEQELMNHLPGREVVSVLTQVEVDSTDPAFRRPSHPVGPLYDDADALRHAHRRGWVMAPEDGKYRRVVPCPEPRGVCQLPTIGRLVKAGVLVVCAGGGGIPVLRDTGGHLHDVDAVIDKDRTSRLLAHGLCADALVLLTGVPAVFRHFGEVGALEIEETTPNELLRLGLSGGAMAPKVQAAARFVRETGGFAAIGALENAIDVVEGRSGTRVRSDVERYHRPALSG